MRNKFTMLTIAVMVTATACQREENGVSPNLKPKINVARNCDAVPINMGGYNLRIRTAVAGLLEISRDSAFRQTVNEEVALQFDGDDNVLLSKMRERGETEGYDLQAAFSESIERYKNSIQSLQGEEFTTDTEVVGDAIEGFAYQPDETNDHDKTIARMQIYIPSVDIVNLNQNPIICINYGNEGEDATNETIVGYRIDADGVLEKFMVTEAMAAQQLVWVIGINERPDVPCGGTTTTWPTGGVVIGTNPICSTSQPCLNLNIKGFKIEILKESWAKGKAELAYAAREYKTGTCGRNFVMFRSMQSDGSPYMLQVNRDDEDTHVSINWQITISGKYLENAEQLDLVLFEYDNATASTHQYRNCSTISTGYTHEENYIDYKSNNPSYGLIGAFYSQFNPYNVAKRYNFNGGGTYIDIEANPIFN